ncbi:MAG: AMP-binding protein [Desulfobacterales bacterium]|jgi:2,3-dihydroxybenzoate-AMP ligase/mycobactin salicyl-AMP ligase
MTLEGFTPYKKEDADKYNRLRWWAGIPFGDFLDKAADIYPDKEALVDGEKRLTYAQLKNQTDKLAIGFIDLGIKPLDRILVQLPNWAEFIYAYFALQKIGAIPILLLAKHRQNEISHLLHLTEANAWVVAEKYHKTAYLPIIDDVLQNSATIGNVILVRASHPGSFLSLESLIQQAELTDEQLTILADRRPDPMQVAHMGPTGGTTGLPKVAPRTHNDYLSRVEYAARACEFNNQDICLVAAPAAHDLTFSMAICITIFTFGKLVMLDSFEPEVVCQTIERENVSAIVWVPTLASRLIHFEGLKDYDLSSLKKMHCGGGVSSRELIKAVHEELDCTFFNGYGGTEGMSLLTRPRYSLERVCSSVGRPTCPYDSYKIVDENGNELPPNTPGELIVKGPGIFSGYYKMPQENEKVFDENGYFRTGDQAMIDDSGDFVLTGRLKEMINRGGESISATDIESLMMTHPGIITVAVVPMPDPELGERVCAYVQRASGAELDFEKIISFLKDQGASVLQLPERIEFVDALPYTKAEKIDKQALMKDIKMKIKIDK